MRGPVLILVIEFVLFGFSYGDLTKQLELCKPQQIHLALGNSVAEMVIMWSTVGQCTTIVNYGLAPNQLTMQGPGENRRFEGEWNKDGVKTLHMVKLRNLTPKTLYHYQTNSSGIVAGPFYFKTLASDQSESVKFMAISDLNTTSDSMLKLLTEAQTGSYSSILHTGNIAMRLSDDGGQNGDRYMRLLQMAAKFVPYMTAPGPMEVDGDTYAQYTHRFLMPDTEWPMTVDRLFYSVDIGGLVHLVSFNTEIFFTSDGKYAQSQHNWLLKDLKVANENREKVPWIVAFGHRPLYCTSVDPELSCNKNKSIVRTGLEDIFYHYGVDLVLTSYGQNYERTYPMYKETLLASNYTYPKGPVYVSLGAASPFDGHNFTKKENWSAKYFTDDTVQSYGRISIMNKSIFIYEQISLKNDEVIDSFTILQENHTKFSTEDLPKKISETIKKQIIESGGKPDDMNIHEIAVPKPTSTTSTITKFIQDIKEGKNRTKLFIAVGVMGGIIILIISLLIVRRVCRGRRRRSARRWEHMDISYGKRYYNKASDKDDLENDFEIDIAENAEPSRKLLTDD